MEKVASKVKKESTLKSILGSSLVGGGGGTLTGAIDGLFGSDLFNSPIVYGLVGLGNLFSDLVDKKKTNDALILDTPAILGAYALTYNLSKGFVEGYKK